MIEEVKQLSVEILEIAMEVSEYFDFCFASTKISLIFDTCIESRVFYEKVKEQNHMDVFVLTDIHIDDNCIDIYFK